ncbi:hypothetical protein LXA43DRAFT_883747 [Ganoderma leucocontextum]|nr:hypothetical protein LXA43DRAFT_883747 [Ganoderma leucocontextum]
MRPSPDVPAESSTGCMRPRTPSQTKSKSRPTSRLKRKTRGEDRPRLSRSTKLARTNSAPRLPDPPCDLALEPVYGLLSEVPQSMLFSFQVAPSPTQTYGAESSASSVSDAAPLDIERFVSTGPEPMFDHSWRIAFVEARISAENGLLQFASDQTVCTHPDTLEECDHTPRSCSSTTVSLPAASLTPPVLLSPRRYPELSDEDASPVSLGPNVQLVGTYGCPGHGNEITECPTHFHPSLRLPPPPPLTTFPIRQPLPSLGFPPPPWTSDYSASHHRARAAGAHVTHPHPFGMPNPAPPLSRLHPAPGAPTPSMPLPVLQPTPCVPTPWCTLFDNLKKRTQADPVPAKKKRRTSALTPDRTVHEAGQHGSAQFTDDIGGNELVHPCPLCPRTFSLPNSLALHLKWHWGASGLEWKRGVNRNGKGLERARAVHEAEDNRRRSSAVHIEQLLHAAEPGASIDRPPTISAIQDAHGTPSPSPVENPNGVVCDSTYPFMMPVVSRASFNVLHMPYYSSSEASTSTSELGASPALSPFDSGGSFPFPRLPSLGELALPQPLTTGALGVRLHDSGFIIPDSSFHAAAGPALGNALQGGLSNHTAWPHNWFGCDHLGDQYESPDVDAEGEEDLDDLSGDPHARLELYTHSGVDGRHAAPENVCPACPRRGVSDKRVAPSSVSHHRARSPASSSSCGSHCNCRHTSPGSLSLSLHPTFSTMPVHAPRLAPSNLPPPLVSTSGDDDATRSSADDDALLAALAPLSDLIALSSPPELDAFDNLCLS